MGVRRPQLKQCLGVGLLSCLVLVTQATADRFLEPPINYATAPEDNPIAALREAIAEGRVALPRDEPLDALKSVLDYLKVPVTSQVLVFSKTSLQQQYIRPDNPRAIYFNDDVYVGMVPGSGLIELSAADPGLGAVFYALDEHETSGPVVVRQTDNCLQCHAGSLTGGTPGHVVRSVFTQADGFPILKAGTFITTQASPFAQRWGGWYVTGTHGSARHMGNVFAVDAGPDARLDREAGANQVQLPAQVNTDNYLSGHSDIVALMVLEHQTQMHNLITQASFDTRLALQDQAVMDELLKRPPGELSESIQRRVANAGAKLVDHLLFADEVELEAPVRGTAGFVEQFAAQGPRDQDGRSLRDFDLETRLFKYPCSYLIYSPQFDGLPREVKDWVFQRLYTILSGHDDRKKDYRLSTAQRKAIREILAETKPGLPDYWQGRQGTPRASSQP